MGRGKRTGRGSSRASNPAPKRQRASGDSEETTSVNTPLTAADIPTLVQAVLEAIPDASSSTVASTARLTAPVDPPDQPSLSRPRTRQTTSLLPTEQTSNRPDRPPRQSASNRPSHAADTDGLRPPPTDPSSPPPLTAADIPVIVNTVINSLPTTSTGSTTESEREEPSPARFPGQPTTAAPESELVNIPRKLKYSL